MPVPVISVAQMRQWEEASWAAGISQTAVIERVGKLIAERLVQLTTEGEVIIVVAGRGHNGDDARAAAAQLTHRKVLVLNVEDPGQALEQFEQIVAESAQPGSRARNWIVDGLFGIGLNRPLDESWTRFIEAINASGLRVFSIDVPSGLNADTGKPEGAAIEATITFTVGAPKTELVRPASARWVGKLELVPDIGLIPCPFQSDLNWTVPEDFDMFPPKRSVESNKGTYGHVAIYAGSLGYHGAAVLASRGALRAQPGLVTLYTQPSAYLPVASQSQAAMVHGWVPTQGHPKNCTAILIGPGLAAADIPENFKDEMRSLWLHSPIPVVCDASALDWFSAGRVSSTAQRVITPHPGEAGRMLGLSPAQVQADRVHAVRELSRRFGNCMVVLKGHQTLIGRSQGDIFVNSTGNSLLAQGGSGDVLAGYLAGLLAQPALKSDPLKTIRYGVWAHGHAADFLSRTRPNWTIEELVEQLGLL